MAWQAYIDSLKAYYPDNAACSGIFGLNGSTWAQEGFDHVQTNYTEITSVAQFFADPAPAFAGGFDFNGEKWVLVKADDECLEAKSKGEAKNPMSIQKCNTCIVIMVGKKGSNGGTVSVAVSKMATYLKENNY